MFGRKRRRLAKCVAVDSTALVAGEVQSQLQNVGGEVAIRCSPHEWPLCATEPTSDCFCRMTAQSPNMPLNSPTPMSAMRMHPLRFGCFMSAHCDVVWVSPTRLSVARSGGTKNLELSPTSTRRHSLRDFFLVGRSWSADLGRQSHGGSNW